MSKAIRDHPTMNEITSLDSTKLYDRRDQIEHLLNAFDRRCRQPSDQREIVMIVGPSGAGKTALATMLKERVHKEKGFFISGKFDQLTANYHATSKSYEAIVVACTELCHQVVEAGPDRVWLVKASIRLALNDVELSVLQDAIPDLRLILGSASQPVVSSRRALCGGLARGVDAEDRFVCIFCKFLFSVCGRHQSPLVMFLDDIQWASKKELDLLKTLATDEKGLRSSKLMILCTYRDDELVPGDYLSTCLDDLKKAEIDVTNIAVTNMSEAAVLEMIADTLLIPANKKVQSLAHTIYNITSGNAFFVQQLLRSLREDRHLVVADNGALRWDESQILQATNNQSVLELLTNKVKQLPDRVKEVLKVASCLGMEFDESVLWAAGTVDKAEVTSALRIAEERGLVVIADPKVSKGYFVHDKVQQAAYSLIPEKDRAAFHLSIGRKIFPVVPPKVEDAHLLLLADQIARGITLVKENDEKLAFAELYLRAGEKAAMLSAYSNSSAFLALGVGLIDEAGWNKKYNIALSLHNTAAEVECYNGNYERVDELVSAVFQHARKFEDTLKAQFTRIYSIGSRSDMHGCVSEALKLLELLGQKFPRNITAVHTAAAFMQCNRKLRGKTDEDILNLPMMKDSFKLTAIQLMILITFWANSVKKQLASLLSVRVVMLTMNYGMNDMCCAGFANLSLVLAIRGDFDTAYRYGIIALQVFENHEIEEWHARVGGSVYGGIYPMKHPYRLSLQPLLAAHRSGLILGDIHISMVCTFFYSAISFCSGASLPQLVKDTAAFRELCIRYKLNTAVATTSVILQVLHNLTGRSTNPLVLTGEAMNEEQALVATRGKHPVAYMFILLYKHTLAVFINDFSEAHRISNLIQQADMGNIFPFLVAQFYFMDGLVAAKLSSASRRHRTRAHGILSRLREYAKHCPKNFQSKVYLVEAELAASAGDMDGALVKYAKSIEMANSQALVHEEALAYERAGFALRDAGMTDGARENLGKARSRYAMWGAQTKVIQLGQIVF